VQPVFGSHAGSTVHGFPSSQLTAEFWSAWQAPWKQLLLDVQASPSSHGVLSAWSP